MLDKDVGTLRLSGSIRITHEAGKGHTCFQEWDLCL